MEEAERFNAFFALIFKVKVNYNQIFHAVHSDAGTGTQAPIGKEGAT